VTFRDTPLPASFEIAPINPRKKSNSNLVHRGRTAGQPNLFTKDLKSAILEAAANIGDEQGREGLVAYLEECARKHRKTYLMLLARLMPLQVDGSLSNTPVSSINVLSIPSGCFLTPEQLKQPSSLSALAIEHAPTAAPAPPTPLLEPVEDPEAKLKAQLATASALLDEILNDGH